MAVVKVLTSVPGGFKQVPATDQIAVDAGIATVQAPYVQGASSLSAQLRSMFSDPIPLVGFVNAAWDGVSTPVDNSDVLATSLSAGKQIVLPYGKMYIGATLPTVVSKPIALKGASRGTQLVFAAAAGGLKFTPSDYSRQAEIKDLEITTLGQEAATALAITYGEVEPRRTRVRISNVRIGGQDHTQNGWKVGMDLDSVCWPWLHDIEIYGREPSGASTAAQYTNMDHGIYMHGGSAYGGGYIRNYRGSSMKRALYAYNPNTSIEGINIVGFDFVGIEYGVYADLAQASAGMVLAEGHINCTKAGVWGKNILQLNSHDVLIYRFPASDSAVPTYGYFLKNSDKARINAVTMVKQSSSGDFIGAHVEDSSYGQFDFQLDGAKTGIEFVGTSGQNYARVDIPGDPTGAVLSTDAGGGNTVFRPRPRIKKSNTSTVTATSGGATAVSSGSFQMLQGETRRVTLSISMTKDVNAGDILVTLYKPLGSATVVWNATKGSVVERRPLGASSSTNFTMTGLLTCTASGEVYVDALAQSLNSNSAISAGEAQLVIEAA